MGAAAGGLHQGLAGGDAGRALLAGLVRPLQCQRLGLALSDLFFGQANAQCGLGVDALAQQDHALGPTLADQARQVLGATGARQQADGGLRQRDLGVLFDDAQVAGQRALQAAAHGVAVDGGDRHATEPGQRFEGFTETACGFTCSGLVARSELVEVGAGGEELLAVTGDHQSVDLAVRVERAHQVAQRRQAVYGPGMRGRVVQGDHGGVAIHLDLQAHMLLGTPILHRSSSSVLSR
ncbi:hypothetical protein G6F35_014594 [Rhizopus arrhizus]|nr:hypothetical protein G6F35_014594 [Rhizopus arrhizus]